MAETFYIGEIPVKTNHPGDFIIHKEMIRLKIAIGEFSGSVDGYWWIVPKEYRKNLEL